MITKHVLIMQKYKYKLIRQKCYYKNQFFFLLLIIYLHNKLILKKIMKLKTV